MRVHVKAGLLSAFVLPGLGQLHKGARIKGVILVMLVNALLLWALVIVMKGMGELLVTTRISGTDAAARVMDSLRAGESSGVRTVMALFAGIWFYGVIDALFGRCPGEDEAAGREGNKV